MTELDPQAQALARSRLYGLLARLLIRGVDELALAQLEQLGWASRPAEVGELLDELAAEHHATFAVGVFPYAGVFLDGSAQAGSYADEVMLRYARAGFTPLLDELPADHLGVELAFLAFVTGAEADAIADGREQLAAGLDRTLAEFLDVCVLGYLPALLTAAEELPNSGFWVVLLGEILALVAEHRARLPGAIEPVALRGLGELLDDPRTGLRRIAEQLLTPAASGVFLSRSDIAALARGRELPRGFGSRLLMLDNLLRSAVEYGELTPLLAALDDRLARRDHGLARLAVAYGLDLAVAPWRDALARSRALLRRVSASAHALQAQAASPMDIEAFYDDATNTLTYVVYDPESRDAVVIDPVLDYEPAGSEITYASVDRVSEFLRAKQLKLHLILETHAHADHLSGSQVLKRRFPGAQTGIGSKITVVQEIFKDVFDLPPEFPTDGRQFDRLLADDELVEAGTLRFTVIPTPGHTPACVTYKFGDALFTGDTMFMPDMGTGRCDFPAGSAEDLYESITQRIYTLPDETRIFVGHDYQPGGRPLAYETSVGAQKAGNKQLPAGRPRAEFVAFRTSRDATLSAPKLLFQSVQVNVDAGALPDPADNRTRYLKIPINAFRPQPEDPAAIVGELIKG